LLFENSTLLFEIFFSNCFLFEIVISSCFSEINFENMISIHFFEIIFEIEFQRVPGM